MPPPADGLETGETGLTDPFRQVRSLAPIRIAITCRQRPRVWRSRDDRKGAAERSLRDEASADAARPDDACLVPAQVSFRLRVPTTLGGVYNATGRGAGGMAEEA